MAIVLGVRGIASIGSMWCSLRLLQAPFSHLTEYSNVGMDAGFS